MNVCDKCFAEISDNAAFCSDCGAPVSNSGNDALLMEGSDRAVYPDLSRANLHKIRGEWSEAETICIDILRRYPNNATAHSLLGDIYAEQDRLDEAINMYHTATELNPNGANDKRKLEQVERRRELQEQERARHAAQRQAATTVERMAPSSRTWTYALLGLVGVLLIVVVALAIQVQRGGQATASAGQVRVSGPSPMPQAPVGAPEPVQRPQSETDVQGQGSNRPAAPDTSTATPNGAQTDYERRILEQIAAADPALAGRLTVMLDPRTRNLVVSFRMDAGALNRPRVAREAAIVAQTVFRASNEAPNLTMRVTAPTQVGGTEVMFMADCRRDAFLQADLNNPSFDPTPLFENVYWSPTGI